MDLSKLGLLNGLTGKMNWLVQRQKVISENIANADTQGYRPNDLAPFSFKNMLKTLAPATTNPNHITLAGAVNGDEAKATAQSMTYETKPDGNAVSTEEEMARAASTASDYQLAANIYKKTIGFLKLAAAPVGQA